MSQMSPTVLVGMSGGVDSSVSAALLQQRGFRVIGGFIKNWSDSRDLWTGECQWRGERRDAMRVAAQLGIPLLTFDFEKAYRDRVVGELFRGYEAGETPNPDVLCNEFIKFGLFVEEAKRLGIEYVATGHYARVIKMMNDGSDVGACATRPPAGTLNVEQDAWHASLRRGADPEKDQSYFLYRVPQDVLTRTFFPIGDLKKSEVRDLARSLNLPVAEKPDSQGICFIGKLDMGEFLRKKIPSKPGDIVDVEGHVLGHHDGLDQYTIGQRQKIGVSSGGNAWYVAVKDLATNRLTVVSDENHPLLFAREVTVHDLHWTCGEVPALPMRVMVQVRYRQPAVAAGLCIDETAIHESRLRVRFDEPVKAPAPGQSAVFYDGDACLGGGVIRSTEQG